LKPREIRRLDRPTENDDRGNGRQAGARRTGLKSPSLLSLDRSLRIISTSPTSAASCSGLRFGEGGGVGQRGARRAISDEFRAAGAIHATAVENQRPRGYGPSRVYREARALTRHRHRRRRRSRTSCRDSGGSSGFPADGMPGSRRRRNFFSFGEPFGDGGAWIVSVWYISL
jgi:hypothetical protein